MRYHWSLGIGHTYSHGTNVNQNRGHHTSLQESVEPHHEEAGSNDADKHSGPAILEEEEDPDPDDPELAMDERENEDLGPEQEEWIDDNHFEESDDELFEMYFL